MKVGSQNSIQWNKDTTLGSMLLGAKFVRHAKWIPSLIHYQELHLRLADIFLRSNPNHWQNMPENSLWTSIQT